MPSNDPTVPCQVWLSHGQAALVDPEDYDDLMQFTWHARRSSSAGTYYAWSHARTTHGKYKGFAMHQYILRAPVGSIVDHINHDGLDNRKVNLRIVTNQENGQNRRGAASNGTTGIRGISIVRNGRRDRNPGTFYYRADVVLSGEHHTRKFPFTDEGLKAAALYVHQRRMQLYPILRTDSFMSDDEALHADCRKRIEELEKNASRGEQEHQELTKRDSDLFYFFAQRGLGDGDQSFYVENVREYVTKLEQKEQAHIGCAEEIRKAKEEAEEKELAIRATLSAHPIQCSCGAGRHHEGWGCRGYAITSVWDFDGATEWELCEDCMTICYRAPSTPPIECSLCGSHNARMRGDTIECLEADCPPGGSAAFVRPPSTPPNPAA